MHRFGGLLLRSVIEAPGTPGLVRPNRQSRLVPGARYGARGADLRGDRVSAPVRGGDPDLIRQPVLPAEIGQLQMVSVTVQVVVKRTFET
jgi:hypothetical protein